MSEKFEGYLASAIAKYGFMVCVVAFACGLILDWSVRSLVLVLFFMILHVWMLACHTEWRANNKERGE